MGKKDRESDDVRGIEDIKSIIGEKVNEINCAMCNLTLKREEVKFLLSSTELLELELPLEKRQVCIDCYSTRNSDVPRMKKYKQRLNSYREISLE